MSNAVAEQIFLFRTLINQRRFDNGTLQILEAILVSRDVKSLLEVRSSLRELMRSESLRIIGEIAGTTVEHKLSVLEFLVRAFALTGDVESCLAFRYEALILRKFRSTSNKLLQVSCSEWMTFAKHLLDNGFYSIARKAYEHAISSFQMTGGVGTHADDFFINDEAIEKIKKLKDVAMVSSASQSVQAQAAELLKRKRMETNIELPLAGKEAKYSASNRFRDGIRKRNIRKLRDHQCIKQTISETYPDLY
ncbi:hypothetical protein NMG60_11014447 [Bertholletia excelsa]